MAVLEACLEKWNATLAPLKESLGEGVTYEQLHLARAFLNREMAKTR